MDPIFVQTIIGALLAILNALTILIITTMRSDMRDIKSSIISELSDVWDRIHHHEHIVECEQRECKIHMTTGVVVGAK